jgi:putative oxidoreductase
MIDIRTAPYGAFVLRLTLGVAFLAYGLLKVIVFTIPGTVQFFQSVGYPPLVAYLVMVGEIGGGLALVLGLWARWIALALIPEMIGVVLFHAPNGWVFDVQGGGWSFPAFWTGALLAQGLLGNGAFALRLDQLAARRPKLTTNRPS